MSTPIIIDGKTGGTPGPATTTVTQVQLTSPGYPAASAAAKSINVRHISGAGGLKIFLPSSPGKFITVLTGTSFLINGVVTHFWVQATAGSIEWEAVAEIAG